MDRHLYHVTYGENLPGIARRGLVPQGGRGIRHGGWEEDSAGCVFFCEYGDPGYYGHTDVDFWRKNYGDSFPFKRTAVLRVLRKDLDAGKLSSNMTTADAGDEWRYAGPVPPESIEYQVDGQWWPIDELADREEGVSPYHEYGPFKRVGKRERKRASGRRA